MNYNIYKFYLNEYEKVSKRLNDISITKTEFVDDIFIEFILEEEIKLKEKLSFLNFILSQSESTNVSMEVKKDA